MGRASGIGSKLLSQIDVSTCRMEKPWGQDTCKQPQLDIQCWDLRCRNVWGWGAIKVSNLIHQKQGWEPRSTKSFGNVWGWGAIKVSNLIHQKQGWEPRSTISFGNVWGWGAIKEQLDPPKTRLRAQIYKTFWDKTLHLTPDTWPTKANVESWGNLRAHAIKHWSPCACIKTPMLRV